MKRLILIVIMGIFVCSSALADLKVVKNKRYGNVYIVHEQIGPKVYAYRHLINKLNNAKRDEVTYIVIRNNRGGYMRTLGHITNAIHRSRGNVFIELQGFAASAAALLLFQGDMARIPYDTGILFHNIRYENIFGGITIPSRTNRKTPYDVELFNASMGWFLRTGIRHLVTKKEWNKLLNGKDIIIKGKRVCNWAKNRNVLRNNKGEFCLVKGRKG